MALSTRDTEHVFQELRGGTTPARGLEAFAASAPPPEGSPPWFGSVYTDSHGACWQEVNLQALSQQPQFLSIGAHGA